MEHLGYAKVIQKRVYFVRGCGYRRYFDFSPWNGGLCRLTGSPGAVVLNGNILGNIKTGEVYRDARFEEVPR